MTEKNRSGQFIILTATLVLLVMVGFAVTLYRSAVDLPEVPPVYATASVMNDSFTSAPREGMANYSREAVSTQSVCGNENEKTAQSVFMSALVGLSPVYSGEGFAVQSEQAFFSMCYIQFNSTSGLAYSRASATVVFSMSSLGLRNYTGYVTFSFIAYVYCRFSQTVQGGNKRRRSLVTS